MRENVSSSAVHGITAWTVYAIVECCFSSLFPRLIKPGYDYLPMHPGFTALLFVVYPVVGLLLGGLTGFALSAATGRRRPRQETEAARYLPLLAVFSVLAAFDVNLVLNSSIGLSDLPALSLSLFLAVGMVASARSRTWFRRLRFLTNPWIVSFLLLGLPWIHEELLSDRSKTPKAEGLLAYTAALFFISLFIQKVRQRRRIVRAAPADAVRPLGSLALLAPLAVIVLGLSFSLKQTPVRGGQHLRPSATHDGRFN